MLLDGIRAIHLRHDEGVIIGLQKAQLERVSNRSRLVHWHNVRHLSAQTAELL